MQRLQHTHLQQLQAWQHMATHSSVQPLAAHIASQSSLQQMAIAPWLQAARVWAPHVQLHRHSSRCRNTAAGDNSNGDVLRPSAQAFAPPIAPTVDVTGTASSTTSHGGSSSSGSSHYSSYSDMYKAVHSTSYVHITQSSGKHISTNAIRHDNAASNNTSRAHSHENTAPAPTLATVQGSSSSGDGVSASTSGSNGHHQVGDSTQSAATAAAGGVEDAIKKAQQALAAAEHSLSSIHKLRSAQPPSKWHDLLQVARSVGIALAAGALLVAAHAFGLGWQWAGATLGAIGLAAHAYQRDTVTAAGGVLAGISILATLGCSLRFGLVMLTYVYSSHKLRRFKESRVAVDFESVTSPAQQPARDWAEVLCITAIPTILAVAFGAMAGCLDVPLGAVPAVETWRADLLTLLQGAVLGWYACCSGDAWSTELGQLSGDQPRLLTTLQPVRRGTHGAVTLLGLSGAAAGGLLVGLVFYCGTLLSPSSWVFHAQRAVAMAQWRLIPLGLIAGLFGSLLDSLLGAILQFTGYISATASLSSVPGPGVKRISGLQQTWMTNSFINLLSASVTAALTALAALRMFG